MGVVKPILFLVVLALSTVTPANSPTAIGITPNRFANDPAVPEILLERFQQTLDVGVSFVVGESTWSALEPTAGHFELGNIAYLMQVARQTGLPVHYTVRIIDNVRRGLPEDLKTRAFDDPETIARMIRLMDTLAPMMKGQVQWLTLGYEVDPYFENHSQEINAFVNLYKVAADRIKTGVPGIRVGATMTFFGIDRLQDSLLPLNQEMDYIALTYCPYSPGFKAIEPAGLPEDFKRMKLVAAGRKIVLQEIAYPTSPLNNGSAEKQAAFYQLAFEQFRLDPHTFEAANFMVLADLSDKDATSFANFYGLDLAEFKSLLQTLGMFDGLGAPKPAWDVMVKNLRLQRPVKKLRRAAKSSTASFPGF